MVAESLFIAQEEQIQSKRGRKQLRSSVIRARIPVGIYDDILIFALILQQKAGFWCALLIWSEIEAQFPAVIGSEIPYSSCTDFWSQAKKDLYRTFSRYADLLSAVDPGVICIHCKYVLFINLSRLKSSAACSGRWCECVFLILWSDMYPINSCSVWFAVPMIGNAPLFLLFW